MGKLQHIKHAKGETYFLVIPAPLVRAKGWVKGQIIDFSLDSVGNVFLKPKT